jgi:glycine betaine/proline transport system substrate-binding protein
MFKLKLTGIALILAVVLLLAGCSDEVDEANANTSYGEQLEYTILGVEPGAGLTKLGKETIEAYNNLDGWQLLESSTAGMLIELGEAFKNEEPIIVTGWSPHWIFAEYDLKFLEDPKGVISEPENIQTLARLGFKEDMPNAYKILDNFNWEIADMSEVMAMEQETSSFEEAAKTWIEENPDKVNEWLEGTEKVDGKDFSLISTPWDTERASAHVMKTVLENQGYNVTLADVDPAVLYEALASGEADASVASWIPVSHGFLYEEHKDDILDLGPNLEGGKSGFVVPAYMDIDSIEDLQPKE